MAKRTPVSVSPMRMLETSTATMVVCSRLGLSWIGFSLRLVCPRKTGVISSAVSVCVGSASVSSVV